MVSFDGVTFFMDFLLLIQNMCIFANSSNGSKSTIINCKLLIIGSLLLVVMAEEVYLIMCEDVGLATCLSWPFAR